jgi:hypothetical protein
LLGAAVVVYGCVILWWHANALATVLIVGAVLLVLAFIFDLNSIMRLRNDRSENTTERAEPIRADRSENTREEAEQQQGAARELTGDTLKRLFEHSGDPLEHGAIPQHVFENRDLLLQLLKPLHPPVHAVSCRVETPNQSFHLVPDLKSQRAAGRLTYGARIPRDNLIDGNYEVQWFELSDDLTQATPIASDSFRIVLSTDSFV